MTRTFDVEHRGVTYAVRLTGGPEVEILVNWTPIARGVLSTQIYTSATLGGDHADSADILAALQTEIVRRLAGP